MDNCFVDALTKVYVPDFHQANYRFGNRNLIAYVRHFQRECILNRIDLKVIFLFLLVDQKGQLE